MQCPSCGTWFADKQVFCYSCGAILETGENKACLGIYRLEAKIGQGGMGIVYKGVDESLDREVAIKVLHQHFLNNPVQTERFRREARMQGQLLHPNIVTLLDVYEDEHVLALVMEMLKGCTLTKYIKYCGIPSWREVIYISQAILAGLEAAHKQGMVHRDLKPSNVFINDDGSIKLMDFGLAKPKESADEDITESGATVGTYYFMAPEQILGEDLDARTDLYSFGVMLYRICTGELPFVGSGGGEFEIMEKQVRQEPIPPNKVNADIPKPLADTILALMAKKQEDRPKDCDAVRELLAEIGEPEPLAPPKEGKKKKPITFSELSTRETPVKPVKEKKTKTVSRESLPPAETETPDDSLIWAFRAKAEAAPDPIPMDLRSPPPIERHVLDRLRESIATIPPLPKLWYQIQKIMEDQEIAPTDLAQAIEHDDKLTNQVIELSRVGSFTVTDSKPINSAALAITRMGMDLALNFIMQILVPNLDGIGSDTSKKDARRIWCHSQAVAMFTAMLADQSQIVDRRSANMFGLMHDIGKLAILHNENEATLDKLRDAVAVSSTCLKAEWDVLGYTHIDAGMMLALHWRLPRSVHRFIYFHHHPCWHQPDTWPMDVQPSIMLAHMSHLALQSMCDDETEGIWTSSRRSRVDETEGLLEHPLRLPVSDKGLFAQMKHELDRLQSMFPDLHPGA